MNRIIINVLMFVLLSISTSYASVPRFVDLYNGTIFDTTSNLLWLKNANCFGNLYGDPAIIASNSLASGQCGLTDGSKDTDWHLPTDYELRTFFAAGYRSNTLNAVGFLNVQPDDYWTSSTIYSSAIVLINAGNGVEGMGSKGGGTRFVWPVRPSQAWLLDGLLLFQESPLKPNIPAGEQTKKEFNIFNKDIVAKEFSVQISGTNASEFIVSPGGLFPCISTTPTLAAGTSCTLLVIALPTTIGSKSATLTFTTASSSQDIPLATTAYSSVLGTITDQATGLPLAGATVALSSGPTTTTDSSGKYDFGPLANDSYSISVSKSGYQNVTKTNLGVTSTSSIRADILLPTTGILNIISSQLFSATAGETYVSYVMLAGGTIPYAFSKPTGTFPPGLSLDSSTGAISGTPSGTGSYTFNIRVADSTAAFSERTFTIDLTPTLAISTASLPRASNGVAYSQTIAATGGKAGYSYSVTSGILPTGLSLAGNGTLSGTPSATGTST